MSEISLSSTDGGECYSMVKCIDTIAKLRELPLDNDLCAIVRGYNSPGDGGGGYFVWDETSPEFEDFGTIIKPDADQAEGCWRRIFDDFVSVKWFGAKGNTKGSEGQFKGSVKGGELFAIEPLFTNFGPENDQGKTIVVWNAETDLKAKPFITKISSVSGDGKKVGLLESFDLTEAYFAWGTDDTDAIKRAVNVASNRGFSVYLPPGHFLITDTIRYNTNQSVVERDYGFVPASPEPRMKPGLRMFGAGVQLTCIHNQIDHGNTLCEHKDEPCNIHCTKNGDPAIRIDGAFQSQATYQQTGSLSDFRITSLGHIYNTTGIEMRSTWAYDIQNVHVMGMGSHAIVIYNRSFSEGSSDWDQVDRVHLDNVFAFKNGGWGIIVDADKYGLSTSKIHIERSRIDQNKCGGIQWTGQGGTIERTGIYGNGVIPGKVFDSKGRVLPPEERVKPEPVPNASGILIKNVYGTSNGLLVTGCEIQGNANVQVMIEVGANIKIIQNDFKSDDILTRPYQMYSFPSVDIQVGDGNLGDPGTTRIRTVNACIIEDNRIRAHYGKADDTSWGTYFKDNPTHTVVKVNANAVGTVIGRWWSQFDTTPRWDGDTAKAGWKFVDVVDNVKADAAGKRSLYPIDIINGNVHAKTHIHRDGIDGGHVLLPFASAFVEITPCLITDQINHVDYTLDTSMWSRFYFIIRDIRFRDGKPTDCPKKNTTGKFVESLKLLNPNVRCVGCPLFLQFENKRNHEVTITFDSEFEAGNGIVLPPYVAPYEVVSGILLFDERGYWKLYTPWSCKGVPLKGTEVKSRLM